jgi:hypothetical protein
MTTKITAADHVAMMLSDPRINKTKNDYAYFGGHGQPLPPDAQPWGQQFKLGKAEAEAMIAEIAANTNPQYRQEVLTALFERTLSQEPTGSVSLSPTAAKAFNQYAASQDLEFVFGSNQPVPPHPLG